VVAEPFIWVDLVAVEMNLKVQVRSRAQTSVPDRSDLLCSAYSLSDDQGNRTNLHVAVYATDLLTRDCMVDGYRDTQTALRLSPDI
jgi:hypothetical protein